MSTAENLREFRQGELLIVCLPVFSQSFLPPLLQSFLARYPQVNIQIVLRESPLLEEWLPVQRHDLGLTETLHTLTGTKCTELPVLDETCVLPQGHPLTKKVVLMPQDFQEESCVSLSRADSYRQLLDTLSNEHQVKHRMVIETYSAASICVTVRAGVGISVVNPLIALGYASGGAAIRRSGISIPFTVSLIHPLHRPTPVLVDVFTAHLQAHLPRFIDLLEAISHPQPKTQTPLHLAHGLPRR